MAIIKPKYEPIPPSVAGNLADLRDRLLRDIKKATDDMASHLSRDVGYAITKIKQSGYKKSVVRREIKRLVNTHYSELRDVLGEQIANASALSGDYHDLMAKYAKSQWGTISAQQRAAIASSALAEQVAKQAKKGPPAKADKIASRYIKPYKETRKLSTRLHSKKVVELRRITNEVLNTIKDGQNLSTASSNLIQAVRKTKAGELAQNQQIPKYMQRLEKSAKKLYRRGSDADWAAWRAQRKQVRKYIDRLAEGGRVKRNLLEVLQKTSDKVKPDIDNIMHFHAADKQRYAAERIIKTETQAAFRSDQVLEDRKHDWIIGYIWRMNRAARRNYVKRTKPSKKKILGRRRRCICELMNGRTVSKDWVADNPVGGHPHCLCWFEPIVDKRAMAVLSPEEY